MTTANSEIENEVEVVLQDGSTILLRPLHPDDAGTCALFINHLGHGAHFVRFDHSRSGLGEEDMLRLCSIDPSKSFTMVAEVHKNEHREIAALGRYVSNAPLPSAEIFITVAEEYQHKGLATQLMEKLSAIARTRGIVFFEADIAADSEAALSLMNSIGFRVTSIKEGNLYRVVMPIKPTKKLLRKESERERKAAVTSIKALLYPESIAVIGASRVPGTVGYSLIRCLIESRFTGAIYPVNPNSDVVQSIKSYPSITDIPGKVDLAIIAVPAALVARVAEECGQKNVRAMIVISDGFKESGPEGAVLEKELREIALGHGMRVVGPNCMGVINTDPAVNMNATFSTVYPSPGNISFLSQSGAMGVVVLDYARSLNTGIASFFSVGNRVDISANDLLQYWEQDPRTKVILLYLESFGNPQKFVNITRRVSLKKPVIIVKSGRTAAGSRAATSHTGSLATSEVVTEALFRQTGALRAGAIEELFDTANLLSNQPLPKGRRLAIITDGGGPGILAADAAAEKGLILNPISPDTAAKIKPHLKRSVRVNNPLDTTPQVTVADFTAVMEVLAEDKEIDAVLAIFIPPVIAEEKDIAEALRKVVPVFRRNHKPLIACYLGQKGFKAKLGTPGKYVPSYAFPENAVAALAKAVEYAEQRSRPKGTVPIFRGLRRNNAGKLIESVLSRDTKRPLWLNTEEIATLLECYGINYAAPQFAKNPEEAAAAALQTGFPVAVKLASATITHKTDVGGVILDVANAAGVEKAFTDIKASLAKSGREKEMDGVTVQPMITGGIETIVGVSHDPSFGPLIMFGMGGTNAELINDVAFRLHPLTDLDARELISSVKTAKLFEGYRGSVPGDRAAMEDLLLRLSAMIEDIPEIQELDFNPVTVLAAGQGYRVVDARISVS